MPTAGSLSWKSLLSLRALLLALFSFFLCAWLLGLTSQRDWLLPLEYNAPEAGDAKYIYAGVKAVSEGNYPFLLSKKMAPFGAPYEGNWDDFPSIEELHFILPGYLTRFLGESPFLAVNLMVVLGHVTAVLGFYAACRLMNYRWEGSMAGALLYGFSAYLFARSVHHFPLLYVWNIPLALVVVRWVAEKEGFATRAQFFGAIAIGVTAGVQHVYYTNLFMQFLGFVMIYHLFQKQWRGAAQAFWVGAATMGAFFVINLDTFWARLTLGPNPLAVSRMYQYLEFSGFKLADLFITPENHWFPKLADWGGRYFSEVILKGEMPNGSYLGIVGIVAFFYLVGKGVMGLLKNPPERPAWEAWLLAWTVVYATVGGFNAWIGSLGFVLFRSTTRYTVFVIALVLLYAVRMASRQTAQWPAMRVAVVALLVTIIGLFDQVPRGESEDRGLIQRTVESDEKFAAALEGATGKNAMVFQLPVMSFPERPAVGVGSYDHFRPYYFTKTLRYSFGDVKGRENTAWQERMALLPPGDLINELERYGFGALYVNPAGLADGGAALIKEGESRGLNLVKSHNSDLFAIILNPSKSPVLPEWGPVFVKGWYEVEADPKGIRSVLCRGEGEILLKNTSGHPEERYLQFYLRGLDDRTVTLQFEEAKQAVEVKGNSVQQFANLKVTLQPGDNYLKFSASGKPLRSMQGPVAFGVVNFRVSDRPIEVRQAKN